MAIRFEYELCSCDYSIVLMTLSLSLKLCPLVRHLYWWKSCRYSLILPLSGILNVTTAEILFLCHKSNWHFSFILQCLAGDCFAIICVIERQDWSHSLVASLCLSLFMWLLRYSLFGLYCHGSIFDPYRSYCHLSSAHSLVACEIRSLYYALRRTACFAWSCHVPPSTYGSHESSFRADFVDHLVALWIYPSVSGPRRCNRIDFWILDVAPRPKWSSFQKWTLSICYHAWSCCRSFRASALYIARVGEALYSPKRPIYSEQIFWLLHLSCLFSL